MLAGGYAISAHSLTERPSRDIDFATASPLPLPRIVDLLADAYRSAGFVVSVIEATPRMARLMLAKDGRTCEVDLLKEAIGPPAQLSIGPVLSLDDAVGLKVRALHDRAAHRDYIDVRAAMLAGYSARDVERLGERHSPGFSPSALADRLGNIHLLDDEEFAVYGLDEHTISAVRAWALDWEADIRARLAAGQSDGAGRPVEDEWDAYLD